ncbi:MAG TPA: RsmE family RNA methyltransferase [Acidimicrobiales bacterium]|nr:RsmE family RNA methyltransferase [Acidimicrobiales bacterium]
MSASTKAHVFVADLGAPELSDDDRHHLDRVLRLRAGDLITVSDGSGGSVDCHFAPMLEPVGEVAHEPQAAPPVVVGFAVVKGERTEWAVQKLTELGADRIVPFVAARSVVRWDAGDKRAARHVERLRRVAREAASQSRRAWLPVVEDVTTFDEVAGRGAALADRAGDPPAPPYGIVLVGPEGGWAPEELATGLPRVKLAVHVLRTETGAVAAGALLSALRAGVVAPSSPSSR